MEAHVGAAVDLERLGQAHVLDQLAEPGEVALVGALGGEQHGAGLQRHAHVQRGARILAQRLGVGTALGQRRRVRHERAPGAAAERHQKAALHERRDRLAQRRAGDPKLAREVALRGQTTPGSQQAEADRRAQTLDGLLERRGRLNGLEHSFQRRAPGYRGAPFHTPKGTDRR